MENVLSNINHTTVEALGFKHVGGYNNGEFDVDHFTRGNITVHLASFGGVTVTVNDNEVEVNSIDDLKKLIFPS